MAQKSATPPLPLPTMVFSEDSPTPEPASSGSGARLVRLQAAGGHPIRHFNGGIVFYPGIPSAVVPLDRWIENQLKHGTLVEV